MFYLISFFQIGALDLITTSRDILRQDLRGVFSFRHLSCQLEEIQSVIGRMLLGDFKTYISTEINKDVVPVVVLEQTVLLIFLSSGWKVISHLASYSSSHSSTSWLEYLNTNMNIFHTFKQKIF